MMRNIDTFIRNMGWVEEEEVERKTKKRVTSKKDEVTKTFENLLDTNVLCGSKYQVSYYELMFYQWVDTNVLSSKLSNFLVTSSFLLVTLFFVLRSIPYF